MTTVAGRPPAIFRRHLATNTVDDPDVLVALACDDSFVVRRAAFDNPVTPPWVLDLLFRAGADQHLRGRGTADPGMDPDDLRRLVECGPWARMLVVDHPNTPPDVLDVLAGQPSARIRESAAQHPRAGAATIGRLCADPEIDVRREANAHPARPVDAHELLRCVGADASLEDLGPTHRPTRVGSATLRAAATLGPWGAFLASRHANCPADTLEQVAASSDWRLRSGILDNPCAEDAFIARAADLEPMDETAMSTGVDQLRVLADRSASVAALAALVDHPRPAVRLALARHPSLAGPIVGRLAADGSPDIRRIAARHPRIDPADVELLVRAGSTPDLMRLADPDPHLPEAELDRLASGGRWARQLAVRHPATPTATLARLMCDEDGKLREWAAAHPAAPRDVIAEIRRAGGAADFQGIAEPDPEVPIDVLRRVAALGPWGAMIVSWHPNAPAELSGSR